MDRGKSGALVALLLACACSPAEAVRNDSSTQSEVAVPGSVATSTAVTASEQARWLVGSWSFEQSCATDFLIHYNADGSLQNGEDSGSWAINGDSVTETLVERFVMGSDGPQKLDPPETRTYAVSRIDADRGTIAFRGKQIPIRRC